ncbi:MAG: tRNA dihydrouridine synthase DusB [Clostridiales bacterium]|nr:tRNA dihydrouridine synthase DusB [Clostridiales bacterium]
MPNSDASLFTLNHENNIELMKSILEENPAVLGPMAGITDYTFRQLAREHGAGLTYTEMISAKALSYNNAKTHALMDIDDEQGMTAVQFFGSEEGVMAEAARQAQDRGALFVDVNMGCPVPKVVKNGEGSALLENPELAARIVRAMANAVDVPITVKIRLGVDSRHLVTPDFALRMEEAGASMIAVHGRTREQYYSGKADWSQIRVIKEAVKAPVVGNGDIRSPEDARRMMEETGCNAVMIGRAALGNPWLTGRIARYLLRQGGDAVIDRDAEQAPAPEAGLRPDRVSGWDPLQTPDREPSRDERIAMALEHCRRLILIKGEKKAMPEMRKHLAWYLKGLPGTAALKDRLFHCVKYAEAEALLQAYANDRNLR